MRKADAITQLVIVVACSLLCLAGDLFAEGATHPVVQVEVPQSFGPRPLEDQTKDAVVRDYLKCWRQMSQAFTGNDVGALDGAFTGIAREKLAGVIAQQQRANITTSYRDRSHHITFVFYSQEGLSIEVVDDAEYDVGLSDDGRFQAMQHVKARYVAVLTPTEVSWKVRMFEGDADGMDDITVQK
jgi:hypothetical protein